jgi:hypothetical protein
MHSFDRDEILATVRERAESDETFRALLLSDPSAAVSEVLGMTLPTAVRISVHEESPADIHLVIPAATHLSDQDLDLVAGGDWSFPNITPTCGCG